LCVAGCVLWGSSGDGSMRSGKEGLQADRCGSANGSVIGRTFRIFKLCVFDYDNCLLRAAVFVSRRPGNFAGR
jgi:hypothetical protein